MRVVAVFRHGFGVLTLVNLVLATPTRRRPVTNKKKGKGKGC